jgi:UDP-N-acetylglucosamine transferase subunit ALG13
MSTPYTAPLVLVTVGGDHHPFERLMTWVENLMLEEGSRLRCVVQYGISTAPLGAETHEYLDHSELLDLMNEARAVVSSGGPSTLLEARRMGHRPIVVPRSSSLGEHVDDHQRAFAARLHKEKVAVRVDTEQEFRVALMAALDAPRVVVNDVQMDTFKAVTRVGDIIDTAVRERGRRRRWHRTPAAAQR